MASSPSNQRASFSRSLLQFAKKISSVAKVTVLTLGALFFEIKIVRDQTQKTTEYGLICFSAFYLAPSFHDLPIVTFKLLILVTRTTCRQPIDF